MVREISHYVYSKPQTRDSRLRFFKINNKKTKIKKNNSGVTNATLLTFVWKRQTVSSKRGENMVTWSLLPFAVNAMLNLSNYLLGHALRGNVTVK